jgi:hypothetical protein
MKKIIIALAFIVSVGVSVAQEGGVSYEITHQSYFDRGAQNFTEFAPIEGVLTTVGRKLTINIPSEDIYAVFTIDYVGRQETRTEVLVEYMDVAQQIRVWFYADKTTGDQRIVLMANGSTVQLRIGRQINGINTASGRSV